MLINVAGQTLPVGPCEVYFTSAVLKRYFMEWLGMAASATFYNPPLRRATGGAQNAKVAHTKCADTPVFYWRSTGGAAGYRPNALHRLYDRRAGHRKRKTPTADAQTEVGPSAGGDAPPPSTSIIDTRRQVCPRGPGEMSRRHSLLIPRRENERRIDINRVCFVC